MYQRFGKKAQFLLVYVREAHPTDGWKMPNSKLTDPRTQAERNEVAAKCCQDLKIQFPALVDTMDDATAVAWAAWPERIFVVGTDGRVAYSGEQGPWGFWPTDAFKRQALKSIAGNKSDAMKSNAKKSGAKKSKADKPTSEVPIRDYRGDSLEAFLTRLVPPMIEVIEPRSAEVRSPTAQGNPSAPERRPQP